MNLPWIGAPLERSDARLKVTGGAQYAAEAPGIDPWYAHLVLSTIANGTVSHIETLGAEQVPGVVHVMTHANAMRVRYEKTSPYDHDLLVLQSDRIFHDRQPVAMVIAQTLEAAKEAAALVRVTYEAEKPLLDLHEAPQYKPDEVLEEDAQYLRGDPDAAFAAAPVKIRETYSTPWETHNPIEAHVTIAQWDGDRLTVHDSTQGVSRVRARLAHTFGVPEENVRVISLFLGGGFGTKGPVWPHVVLAAMAAKAVGHAVKLELTRSQMYGSTGYRPPTFQTISLGAQRDGKLVSICHETLTQTAQFAQWMESSGLITKSLYDSPNLKVTHRAARLHVPKPSFMRAPGEASGSYAIECAMDELAYAVDTDPIELRLRNYAAVDPDSAKPFSSKSLRQCYAIGAEKIGWSKRSPEPRSMQLDGKLVGLGMATATYPAWRQEAQARIRMDADGNVVLQSGTQDLGTGSYTVFAQLAAAVLGISPERVRMELGDTDLPKAPLSAGSSTAASVGSAVLLAAQALRAKLDAGSYGGEPLDVKANGDDEEESYSTHAFGAQFAQVEVDPELGEVRVVRFIGAFAGGRILNARTARSQYIGGMVWGIGMALLEQTHVDPRTGRVMSPDLEHYLLPVNADVPAVEAYLVEERDDAINPLGAKGIGEIGIVGAAAAIANAVYHATGRRVRDLPITCDKLL
jgi:xanthine dehydrogenase YagR molybdenum-binding subunit